MTAKRIIPDFVFALVLAVLIIALGIFAVNTAARLLPDHKDTVVTVDMTDAPKISPGFEDIMKSWPWTLISDETPYTGGMPDWLRDGVVKLAEVFPGPGEISLSESELYFKEGIYFVKNIRVKSGEKDLIMSAAFKINGGMISFNIDPIQRGNYEATVINECYKALCDSAEYHRLNGSSTDLTYYLDMFKAGLFESAEDVPENSVLTESDSILYTDPLSDFFYSYCYRLAGEDDYYGALQIISILNSESPKSYYREGKIYLFYEDAGTGELTLSWDLETFRFAGMTYKGN